MNIFRLDNDPVQAAVYQHDKHVVKMVVETAQLLSTALRTICLNSSSINTNNLYKVTHVRHPCSIWTMSAPENMQWLFEHGYALLNEYTHRYNKIHKSSIVIDNANAIAKHVPTKAWTQEILVPPQCMPEEYHRSDVVEAYRQYYISCKLMPAGRPAKWRNRKVPVWISNVV